EITGAVELPDIPGLFRADPIDVAEASRDQEELVVADLNLEEIEEVRHTWQFYRDRRPETYESLVKL
ncbi:MAG: acyltransferase, partial [Cyanobacteria bacterium HKST-UBA02]|nr:acyltransferase [Cyanobacteria bacterium HKST-UBA02]